MKWKFWKSEPEHRASYTEGALLSILREATEGKKADPRETAAATAASGILGRSMAMAVVSPERAAQALTAPILEDIGRSLILRGECVYAIEVSRGRIRLSRACDWEISGRERWSYRLTLPQPMSERVVMLPGESVLHFRINSPLAEPFKGRSPLDTAGYTGYLLAACERLLGNECGAPSGWVLPAPLESIQPEDLTALKEDLRVLAGRTSIVPSMATSWGEGRSGAPADWQPRRLGAAPPDVLVNLRNAGHDAMLGACGVPAAMFAAKTDASGAREALRQFLHTTLQPIGELVSAEASEKLEVPVSFDFARLSAADVQGRARAFQSLVAGGMEINQAAAASGILKEEDS